MKGIKSFDKCNILDLTKQNEKYFLITQSILSNSKFSYSGILNILELYRCNLISLRENISQYTENTFITDIVQKRYDSLITELYNELLHYVKMEIIDCGVVKRAIFDINNTDYTRNVGLTYLTCNGAVVNNAVAKLDNMSVTDNEFEIVVVIGNFTFHFYKSSGIDLFTVDNLINKINSYETDVINLEREINKNIKIIQQGEAILNIVKTTNFM